MNDLYDTNFQFNGKFCKFIFVKYHTGVIGNFKGHRRRTNCDVKEMFQIENS
jgi:hypothetical protein